MSKVDRLGFSPYVKGLDEAIGGGVPAGSWTMVFGDPGAYKTLHALAWILAGLKSGERAVYVTTEQSWKQTTLQIDSMGWEYKAYQHHLTDRSIETEDYGNYELVWIDLDSLDSLARRMNILVREVREERRKKVYFYDDPTLLTYAIMLGLGAVGAIQWDERKLDLNVADYARISRALYVSDRQRSEKLRKYIPFTVNRKVRVRVVIDSISPFIIGRYSIGGKILTNMRIRLMAPMHTYLVLSHVSKTTDEELGAALGHITDGRIRLWTETIWKEKVDRVYGLIKKMRLTEHSRVVHSVEVKGGEHKYIEWKPLV